MANSRSARKAIRASERKRVRNRAVRSSVRTYIAHARHAVLGQGEQLDVEAALKAAVKALDRAAEKGILHRNNANRRKSRLTAMAAKIMRTAESEQAAVKSAAAGGRKGIAGKAKATTAKKPAAKAAAAKKPATKPAAKKA